MKDKKARVEVKKTIQEESYEPFVLGILMEGTLEEGETYQGAAQTLYGEAMEALHVGFLRRAAELDMDREKIEAVLGKAATEVVVEDEDKNPLDDINLDL